MKTTKNSLLIVLIGLMPLGLLAQEIDSLKQDKTVNTTPFKKYSDDELDDFLEEDEPKKEVQQKEESVENEVSKKESVPVEVVEEDPVIEYQLPKLSIKISPLHFIGDHLINRFPSANLGVEWRIKDSNNSLYTEVGYISHTLGISANAPIWLLTGDTNDGPELWNDDVLSNQGIRAREQFRHYYRRGKRAFAFIGAELGYLYQHTDFGAWRWNNFMERYYEYTMLKREFSLKPIAGFSFFSKKEEFEGFMDRMNLDLYLGVGVRFVSRIENGLPQQNEDDFWEEGPFALSSAYDDSVEGEYFSPSFTLGFRLGVVISK